jgi:hypothetical protein
VNASGVALTPILMRSSMASWYAFNTSAHGSGAAGFGGGCSRGGAVVGAAGGETGADEVGGAAGVGGAGGSSGGAVDAIAASKSSMDVSPEGSSTAVSGGTYSPAPASSVPPFSPSS